MKTRTFDVTIGSRSTRIRLTQDRLIESGEAWMLPVIPPHISEWNHKFLYRIALELAVEKMYGKSCFWLASCGLSGYGQVFRALKPTKANSNPGNAAVTSQVGASVVEI